MREDLLRVIRAYIRTLQNGVGEEILVDEGFE